MIGNENINPNVLTDPNVLTEELQSAVCVEPELSRRAQDRNRHRLRRSNITEEELAKDRERQRQRRANLNEEQLARDRERQRERRLHLMEEHVRPDCSARNSIENLPEEEMQQHYAGKMDQICEYCGAFFWNAERTKSGTKAYTRCCGKGSVKLRPVNAPTAYIKELLLHESEDSRIFLTKPRAFNTKVSFASV
jgi:hypothetical protein